MRAIVLAAGLGSRLKPWTLEHPKALVPVGGVPMLERVLRKLEAEKFNNIAVTAHHFYIQIEDFIRDYKPAEGVSISVSVENNILLDTGGGVLQASSILEGEGSVLVHNVDILSDVQLSEMMQWHDSEQCDITLLTSDRETTRHLLFDKNGILRGWRNETTGETRIIDSTDSKDKESLVARAFSGIYVLSSKALSDLRRFADERNYPGGVFPIMDYFLAQHSGIIKKEFYKPTLNLIDIGKPETLCEADNLFKINRIK